MKMRVCSIGLILACITNMYADEAEIRLQLQRSLKRYESAGDWTTRREELRREFLKGARLWPLPKRPSVPAITHSRREYSGYSVENVALETIPGFYCTGNLYRPVGRKDLSPLVLSPHGHFRPQGRYRESQQIRCAHLARMGATVFSYSMVGWQDSQQTTHDDPLVLALQTWNSIRVVDYLTGLNRVDPNRVGITGASGGGTQSMFLALVDERIKASAPLVIIYPWAAPEGCLCEGGLPVMQAARTNAIELAAATAPRPQLLISVAKDPTEKFPSRGLRFIREIYRRVGAERNVESFHFSNEGHDFGPSKRKLVYDFFARHLRLSSNQFIASGDGLADLTIEDRDAITIESPAQLSAFNENHPLPANALRGSQAVAVAFERHLAELRRRSTGTAHLVRVADSPKAEYSFREADSQDEALLFTPAGFDKVGNPRVARGAGTGSIGLTVRDKLTGNPTHCRINVIGRDGNYYEPNENVLKQFSMTGVWPGSGWGNRPGKAPIRYIGRFFFSDGTDHIEVPAGPIRIEVWKGFEYRPTRMTLHVAAGQVRDVEMTLDNPVRMTELGYWSGDPHIHIQRRSEEDEQRILDLMVAEDVHFGAILAYNEPAGPYAGFMRDMDSPQFRGVGRRSIVGRGSYEIISGQEYRTGSYGHLNLFLLDDLVRPGQSYDANNWPVYGNIAAQARAAGAVSFYAHGGYAKEIYADVVQGKIDGVELLQFGVYRGIGLIDWYHMMNAGFKVPANGACDYPACRMLGDCRTYVQIGKQADAESWLRGMARGESFVTSGPLIMLEVDGKRPGGTIEKAGDGPHVVRARVRVRSEVAPITNVQLIANGRIVHELALPSESGQDAWIELEQAVEFEDSIWIAARAFSLSRLGTPDAESHTNPVFVQIDGRAPYEQESLDHLVSAIDKQITIHKNRTFPEQAKVIAYFERSRDILMKIRELGGAPSVGHPSDLLKHDGSMEDPGRRTHSEEELRAFLRPLPAKPIETVLKSFETVDGFKMQLVAREPLVRDPIAASFDEYGNLYVCEMRDYPFKPKEGAEPIGTLRLLRDIDGDGVFDESHIFADKLLWAGGVAPWKGGVFVAAPPDIWYMKDTDGDHRADIRTRVYTGFGTGNQQAMLNNLSWGLDHKIYGSTAGNGGSVSYGQNPQGYPEPVSVSGRDFRFAPESLRFESITGTVQFGNSFDDWGNRFLCSESRPLLHAVLPQHYLERNPFLPVQYPLKNLTGRAVPSFRISPLERWRMIRSSRRIAHGNRSANSAGASHHVMDAAAGVTIYRGGAYPKQYYGNVFIGGAQNNLVHRRVLTADGVTFTSKRGDPGTEFVRSSDNWFRPVNFVNAPDGTLYVLDMSREILETIHVPLDVTKFIDFRSGREHGRVYRIAPSGFSFPGPPTLGTASSDELVEALGSPHGWVRDTAHRLIYEQQDRAAVGPLRISLRTHVQDQTRLLALWSLHGLDQLSDEDLMVSLQDRNHSVREHAMRLSEPRLDTAPSLLETIVDLSTHADVRLRFQSAFSLGESMNPDAAQALADLARRSSEDPWMRTAVLSSVRQHADQMFVKLLDDSALATSSGGRAMLAQLATVVGSSAKNIETSGVLVSLASHSTVLADLGLRRQLFRAVAEGRIRSGRSLRGGGSQATVDFLDQIFRESVGLAQSVKAASGSRRQAIKILGVFPLPRSGQHLEELLDISQPEPIQLEAVKALAGYSDDRVGSILLAGWDSHSPGVRMEVIEALLSRPSRTLKYLRAAQAGKVSIAQLDLSQRSMLLKHSEKTVRGLAQDVLEGHELGGRAQVLDDYRPALSLTGDAARGEKIYGKNCAACHRIGKTGYAIGPDLTGNATRDPLTILGHILVPNQYLLPTYENYVVADISGRLYTGMLASQSATSVTLKRGENKTDTVLRSNIEELSSTGKSLMPEGFEQQINKQGMADLISFLQTGTNKDSQGTQLHIGTLPGLIEPEDN